MHLHGLYYSSIEYEGGGWDVARFGASDNLTLLQLSVNDALKHSLRRHRRR